MKLSFETLKQQQRLDRENYSSNLGLRVHRALSWLEKSEQAENDLDSQFIYLWIAFNAAYANEININRRITEQETFRNFIERLCELDTDKNLSNFLWLQFANSIRVLLKNKYIFQPFWDYQNHKIGDDEWRAEFKAANAFASKALGHKQTSVVLSIIFSRLYTLRNQILHGGATWNSGVNRDQVRDATTIMKNVMPMIIKIMMDNYRELWGEPCYPVVDHS
ncbi:hypothetical protein ACOI22_09755 [Glaciecola sp. 2405UD65-10]|uniref:hypothetical protein n=1 Tax=Glaciecola sp. 2405UD65-10 TaxID=3397244 RepID=UPI003B5C10E4